MIIHQSISDLTDICILILLVVWITALKRQCSQHLSPTIRPFRSRRMILHGQQQLQKMCSNVELQAVSFLRLLTCNAKCSPGLSPVRWRLSWLRRRHCHATINLPVDWRCSFSDAACRGGVKTFPFACISPRPLSARPMSDHFALVPRALADGFFSAVEAFYACDGSSWPPQESWWQPGCHGMGFEESVLFRHIHASGVPYRYYTMFEYVVTRGASGGVCYLGGSVYTPACNVLGLSGALREPFSG